MQAALIRERQKYMNRASVWKKKITVIGLAAVLSVSGLSGVVSAASRTLRAATGTSYPQAQKVELSFDGSSARNATIIRGDTITIKASNVADRAQLDQPLNIVRTEEGGNIEVNDLFKLSGQKETITLRPLTQKELAGSGKTAADGNYELRSNYGTMVWKANDANAIGTGATASGSFILQDSTAKEGFNILSDAAMVLQYLGDDSFTIVQTGSDAPTGIFANFTTEVRCTEHIEGTATQKETFILQFQEKQPNSSQIMTRTVEFTPNYTRTVTDPNTGDILEKIYNVPAGAQYRIHYQFDTSSPLTLTVKDPQQVLADVADACVLSDLNKNSYINPRDDDNDVKYITGNIGLGSTTTIFGQTVRLTWEWVPDNAADQNAVSISSSAVRGEYTAEVTRKETDIGGKLRVTASFKTENLNQDVAFTSLDGSGNVLQAVQAELPITLHGMGTPAVIETIMGDVGSLSGIDTQVLLKSAGDIKMPQKIEMDVYNNQVAGYTLTTKPYQVKFEIDLGKDNGRTRQMYVNLLTADGKKYNGGGVTAVIQAGSGDPSPYTFGTAFDNTRGEGAARATLTITAEQAIPQNLTMQFQFFVTGPAGAGYREEKTARQETLLLVSDTTPDTTAMLTDIIVRNNGKKIDDYFTFNKDTKNYEINLPYKLSSNDGEELKLNLRPLAWQTCSKIVGIKVETLQKNGLYTDANTATGWPGMDSCRQEWQDENGGSAPGYSIDTSEQIDNNTDIELTAGQTLRVTFKVRAQHPQYVESYTLVIHREMPSDDSSLKALQVTDEAGKNYLPALSDGVMEYSFTVPYGTKYLKIDPVTTHERASIAETQPALVKREGMSSDRTEWWSLADVTTETQGTLQIVVQAEDGLAVHRTTYILHVIKEAPSTESHLTALQVTDMSNKVLTYTPAFHTEMNGDYYELRVPYTTSAVKIAATPKSNLCTMELQYNALFPDETENTGAPVTVPMNATNAFQVPLPIIRDETQFFVTTVHVTAEDGSTVTDYPLHIYREAPSTDNTLSGLAIKDAASGTDISTTENFYFEPQVSDYNVSVPYEMEKVTFTPTAAYSGARKITVNGLTVNSGAVSQSCKLDYPASTTIEVVVYPEDPDENFAPSKTYTITFTRRDPSSDARLKALTLENTEHFSPLFLPDTLEYSADVTLGAEGVYVLATPNHAYASMTINGVRVENGQKSPLIEFLQEKEDITIVVTAQDGVTKRTYIIHMTDQNKIERSSNADLKSLRIIDGVCTPEFQPAVTDYEVAVTEETYSVKLLPVPADPMAEVKVFSGTKEIGDEEGNYAAAIQDGENAFTVKVTAPDNSKTQEYNINVYRNEEDKLNVLTPVTADDINFDLTDPVVVDISKYARISADVFIKMRDEYPAKTIVFEGNDYSLRIKGSEITKNIPETEIYDFRMSYDCDERPQVEQMIGEDPSNASLNVVHVHFAHHGDLPAPTILTLSLGQKYGSRTLYWHYYNAERERIDYYGSMATNARGTFTLKMTHMSHYIVTYPHSIIGAEDRSGSVSLSPTSDSGKTNPNTGEKP